MKEREEERKERLEMKMEDYDADDALLDAQKRRGEDSEEYQDEESVGGVSMYVYKE